MRKGREMERQEMVLIGVGANLPGPEGPPLATCEAALAALAAAGVGIVKRSRWFESAPWPRADQPWYVNGVARVETGLDPAGLLALLHRIEDQHGRRRTSRDAARTLDLDLLAYGERVEAPAAGPVLPHPRMHERAFVLLPLAEVAPNWRHPADGRALADLIAALPPEQITRPLPP